MMLLESLLRDARHALRHLMKAPALAATAIIALALGIGANTAIFSLFDAIVFRTLPVQAPDRLVLLGSIGPNGPRASFSYPAYIHLQSNAHPTADLFAHAGLGTIDASIDGLPETAIRDVAMVSGNYFSALHVATILGRPIASSDDAPAADTAVAVISDRLWKRRFSSDRTTIGRSLTLNGSTFTIVGVAPARFFGTSVGDMVDLWIPLAALPRVVSPAAGRPPLLGDINANWLTVMGRLAPGATMQTATRDLDATFGQFLQQTFGPRGENRPDLASERLALSDGSRGVSGMRDQLGAALLVLMALVVIVLLIACANVANLFVGRALSRQREIAIRQALGASRRDLFRQLFTESLIVAVAGGTLGLLLARWSWSGLLALMSPGRTFAPVDVQLDTRVLAFTTLTSIVAAMLCGLAPAWQAGRRNLIAALKLDSLDLLHERWGRHAGLATKALLVAQVALSACLLVAAGQLVRSFHNLTSVPIGFVASNQIVLQIDTKRTGVPRERLRPLFERIRDRLASLPNVRAVAISNSGFFSGSQTLVEVSSFENASPNQRADAVWMGVTPGYFATLGSSLYTGRDFTPQDATAAPLVAIVNETLARRCFGDRNPAESPAGSPAGSPVGSILRLGKNMRLRVIGVVRDTRYRSLRMDTPPIVYTSLWQSPPAPPATAMFTVRVDTPPTAAFAALVAREVHAAAPQLIVADMTTLTDLIDRTLTTDRLVATMSAAFGLLAMTLAACGLFAAMSTAVTRRTREIGIRAAIGANPRQLARAVIGEALVTVCLGVAVGLIAAALGTRLIAHFIFGLSTRDPLTFAAAALLLLVVGVMASYLPARRAAAVDPLIAIRCD